MPVGPYKTFASCVSAQRRKGKSAQSARAVCGSIEANMTKSDVDMTTLAKSAEKRYTLGVVYEPDEVDTQGDFAKSEDIECAAWGFMERLQSFAKAGAAFVGLVRSDSTEGEVEIEVDESLLSKDADGLDDEHLQTSEHVGVIVESYVAPAEMTVGDQTVKKGSWLLGVVWTEDMFGKIKAGERTGLSMFGRAGRVST